jgi:hypothetical protein
MTPKERKEAFLQMTFQEKRGGITFVRPMRNVLQECLPGTLLSSPQHGVFQVYTGADGYNTVRFIKPPDNTAPENLFDRRYDFKKGEEVEFWHPVKGWCFATVHEVPSKATNRWILVYGDHKFASVYPWLIRRGK